MKKRCTLALTLCLLITMSTVVFAKDKVGINKISLKVNERPYTTEENIENINGSLMISAYDFVNMFGGVVDENEKICSIGWGNKRIIFTEGKSIAQIGSGDYNQNYSGVKLSDKAYKTKDGIFMIPLRSTVENFIKTDVLWNDKEKTTSITIPKIYEAISEEDSLKMKNKKINSIEIIFDNITTVMMDDEVEQRENLQLIEEEDIKKAVDLFYSLLSYKTPDCRCEAVNMTYKIVYADKEKQEIKIIGVKNCSEVLEKFLAE